MNSSAPAVSVVIPTYNRAQFIERTINSVLQQTFGDFEIIVVDDASNDNTEEVVKNINDSRIRYVRLPNNTNGTRPRNYGIELSTGKFIAFLDSDDEWMPEKLEKQLNFILASVKGIDNIMCFTGLVLDDEFSRITKRNKPYINGMDIMSYIFLGGNTVQTSTYMVSSSLAKAVKFDSDLRKHQDWDFCLRLRNNRAEFLYLDECLSIWHVGNRKDRLSNANSNGNSSLEWLESKKGQLSLSTQSIFQLIVTVDDLVMKKKYNRAALLAIKSLVKRKIGFFAFLRITARIVLPSHLRSEISSVLSRF
ncbi:glycosyltransferase family 2 protein [Planococcus beigongshangi]|uniref:glycosyltransferase family 2 protein n=1 Tax=Planococcus beigongshangi TaxID=2782536 RepID=UPI00193BEA46|nr:glycosyltransferase family 2 protein [Planococcus beigongshangi]